MVPDLGRMRLRGLGQNEFEIHTDVGEIRVTDEMQSWEVSSDESGEAEEVFQEMISNTLVLCCQLDVEGGQLVLSATLDEGTPGCPQDRIVRSMKALLRTGVMPTFLD